MSYGERLHRTDMAMAMSMESDARTKSTELNIKATQTEVARFEFSVAIVDHNLEDERERKLDFRNSIDFGQLDGRIGEEISELIEKMHDWTTDLPNSEPKSTAESTGSELEGLVLEKTASTTSG
jgi:hypothetical protein